MFRNREMCNLMFTCLDTELNDNVFPCVHTYILFSFFLAVDVSQGLVIHKLEKKHFLYLSVYIYHGQLQIKYRINSNHHNYNTQYIIIWCRFLLN